MKREHEDGRPKTYAARCTCEECLREIHNAGLRMAFDAVVSELRAELCYPHFIVGRIQTLRLRFEEET